MTILSPKAALAGLIEKFGQWVAILLLLCFEFIDWLADVFWRLRGHTMPPRHRGWNCIG